MLVDPVYKIVSKIMSYHGGMSSMAQCTTITAVKLLLLQLLHSTIHLLHAALVTLLYTQCSPRLVD